MAKRPWWQIALMILTLVAAVVLAVMYRRNSYFEPAPPAVPVPPPSAPQLVVPVPTPPPVPVPPPPPPPPATAMPAMPPPPATAMPAMPPPPATAPMIPPTPIPTPLPEGSQTSMMPQTLSEFDSDISGFNKEDLSYEYTSEAPVTAPEAPSAPPATASTSGVEMYVRSPYAEF